MLSSSKITLSDVAFPDITKVLADVLAVAPYGEELIAFVRRGKMVRATLTVAATRAICGSATAEVTATAVLECLHSAALIQDDIVDNATMRRGTEALHVRLGVGSALMLADYLIGAALSLLTNGVDISAHAKVRGLREVAQCITTCSRGQILEATLVSCFDHHAEETYLRTIAEKTGAQFIMAATLGPILSGCDEEKIQSLAAYGAATGSAFQVHDDVLDLRGNAEIMGKPVQNSLHNGRLLIPLVYLAQHGSRSARTALSRFQDTGNGWSDVRMFLDSERTWDRVVALEQQFIATALTHLGKLPQNSWTRALAAIATSTGSRDA